MSNDPFYEATLPTLASGAQLRGMGRVTSRGELLVATSSGGVVQTALANNAATIAASATADKAPAIDFLYNWNGTTWERVRKPNATSRLASSAASVNATVAKASPGDLYTIHGFNAAAAVRFLKLYDKATAPTVGTDIPVMVYGLEAGKAFDIDCYGHYFASGISWAITQLAADADTTALVAADVVGMTMNFA